jgi:hypothetical protein
MLIVGEIREHQAGGLFALPGEKSSGLIGLNEARVPPKQANHRSIGYHRSVSFSRAGLMA